MLPFIGRGIVLSTFVGIIKYILKCFINSGRRKSDLIYSFDACALRSRDVLQSFKLMEYLIIPTCLIWK